jgi:3-hydroxyacyl-[acyl-carrier-protein] dehydratase
MPREPLYDLSTVDYSKVEISQEEIYQVNLHRYEFMMLDGIFVSDFEKQVAVGYRDIRDDAFWVRGHIPGRPIFPGVLMIETAAQLVSYYAQRVRGGKGFLGFGGVDDVKFRGAVVPGDRLIMLGKVIEIRDRRCVGETQAYVDGKMVYEGRITGMWI